MPTSKDDYLINTLRFVSTREETQIYGAILPESLTSPEMKEQNLTRLTLALLQELHLLSRQESSRSLICMDNAKITRKWSELDKHGHGNGKSAQEPGISNKHLDINDCLEKGVGTANSKQIELMLGSKANIEGPGLEILDAPQGPRRFISRL
ncbi:hypothetical protein Tco_0321488 [Tanacetum coccineum]